MNGQIGFEPEEVEATLNKLQYASDDIIGTGFSVGQPPYDGDVVGEALTPYTNVLEWVSKKLGAFAQNAPGYLGARAIDVRDTIRDLDELDRGFEQELHNNVEWVFDIPGATDPGAASPAGPSPSAPPPAGAGGMPNAGSGGAAPAAAGGMPNAPVDASGEGTN